MAERLQKFLSRAGVASRRKAEALIAAGAVTVNGVRAELGQSVVPGDDVRVNGVRAAVQEHVTFLLFKPAGVLSSVSDDRGRETVIDLLPPVPGLHPVGRLDLESEGLLLVTNDAWFGLRAGPLQHLGLGRLRAIEQGLPLVRAANTGVSAVIDGKGRVLARLPLREAGSIEAPLPPALSPTVYARTGDLPALLLVAALAALAVARRRLDPGGPRP